MASNGAASAANQVLTKADNPSDNTVQRTRAWTGMWVVIGGDVAIAAAAGFGVWKTAGSANTAPMIAILTSAFTAISTMTTAYFGIKTMSNTAQSFAPAVHSAMQTAAAKLDPGSAGPAKGSTDTGGGRPPGPPVPADPAHPTDAEIVARMEEPPKSAG